MASTKAQWLASGEKFALLGLDVEFAPGGPVPPLNGGMEVLTKAAFQVPDHWRDWLGTARVDEAEDCGAFILAKAPTSSPGVLDHDNNALEGKLHHMLMGLQLTRKLGMHHPPFIASGGWSDYGGVDVRSFQHLSTPRYAIVNDTRPITLSELEEAATVGARLWEISEARSISNWRLLRCVSIYRDAGTSLNLLDRIHQFARCVEGLILPEEGKTKSQFKGRTELFVGPRHHDLLGEVYGVRSDIEHMHENKHLEKFDRTTRLRLAELEAVIEWVARSSLRRIVLSRDLSGHFGSAAALDHFWKMDSNMRQAAWGSFVDPRAMLQGFNPDEVSDEELGAH